MHIQWLHDSPLEGYCGLIRIRLRETIPAASWKATAEALEQIPGSSHLRPGGVVLSEDGPTEEAVRAAAVLLCQRLLAREVAA